MRKILLLGATAMLAAPVVWGSTAHADTISIGLKELGYNSNQIITEATSSTGGIGYMGGYGSFNFNNISATGSPILPEPALDTTSIQVGSSTAGTIDVFVTEIGLTTPQGVSSFLSGFSSNLFNGSAVSVRELTYISATNAMDYSGTLLASTTFTGLNSTSSTNATPLLSGPYSETVEYIVTVGAGTSDVNDTIDLSLAAKVPEPISLALLGSGLLGLGAVRLRRRG